MTDASWAMLLALALALLLATGLLALLGIRDGDRPEDARVGARLVEIRGPDAPEVHAEITVGNRSQGVIMASARVDRAPRAARLLRFDQSRRTAFLHPGTLQHQEVLGALSPGSVGTWRLPAGAVQADLFRIRVWVDEPGLRTRIASFICQAPPPPGMGGAPARTALSESAPPH
jgi:hypothetical protein